MTNCPDLTGSEAKIFLTGIILNVNTPRNNTYLPGTAWLGSFPIGLNLALAAVLALFPMGAVVFSALTDQSIGVSAALFCGCLMLVSWYLLGSVTSFISGLIHSWLNMAGRIGSGDFSARMSPQGGHDAIMAARHFNDMARNVGRMISEIRDSAAEVAYATVELRAGACKVSDATLHQSEAASQTASAVEEITSSISHTANQSHEAEQISHTVSELSGAGGQAITQSSDVVQGLATVVEDFSKKMEGLAERSSEVGQATGLIRDISEQTNLLALNAAIEAARAGEQGRGFAVVADEVRNLAQRANDSANEITKTVTAIQSGIQQAAEQMATVGTQAQESVAQTNEVSEVLIKIDAQAMTALNNVRQISSGTQQQSINSSKIAEHIEQIAQGAQTNSHTAAETVDLASHLEYLTGGMRNVLTNFRD